MQENGQSTQGILREVRRESIVVSGGTLKSKSQMKKYQIEVPLPMSVNKMYMYNPRTRQKIYKKEARDYLDFESWEVAAYMRENKLLPIDKLSYFDMIFYLPNKNCDSHNYKKIAIDLMQRGGVVTNDKYVMDRTQEVHYDKEKPRIIISWTMTPSSTL